MDRQAITGAVISTDPQFRAVFHPNGDGHPSPVEVSFEILVPFVSQLVPTVDVPGGRVVVEDRPGLLTPAADDEGGGA